MATPAAILETVVRANTTAAVRDLRQYDSYLHRVDKSSVSTTARTSTLGKATGTLGSKMRSAAGYAAGAAAAYVSIAQAKAAVTTTQDLAKTTAGLNRNLGLTVKEGSRWASVAKSRDIDAKSLTMSFTTLSRRVVDAGAAIKEGGAAADTAMAPFKRLGLSQQDVVKGSKDLDAFIPKLADAFGDAAGGAERQASAQQLLGRGYATILPLFADGAKGLREQQEWADKYGTTLTQKTLKAQMDLVSAQRESKTAWLGIQVAFAKFVTPALKTANEEFQKIAAIMADKDLTDAEKFKRVGEIIEKWASKALDAFVGILPQLVERAGEAAPKIAGAFVKGFLNAPILGQLLLGGWLLTKMGGLGAAASIGTKLGTTIGKFAGPAAALVIGVELGREFSKTDFAHEVIHHMDGIGDKIAEELDIGLKKAQGVARWMEAHPGVGAPEAFKEWREAAQQTRQAVNDDIDLLRNRWGASLKEINQRTKENFTEIRRTMGENSTQAKIAVMNNFDAAVDAIKRSMEAGKISANQGAKAIHQVLLKQLKSYGIQDPEGFLNRSESVKNTGGEGHRGLQGGGMVPGYGTGDKVPLHIGGKMAAMVEPGEYVSVANKRATAALMAANSAVPRFAKGGTIPGDTGGLNPPIMSLLNSLYSKYGGSVSSGQRPGTLHQTGNAADYVPNNWAGAAAAVNAVGSKLLEGIYNAAMGGPPVSWDSGQKVPPSFWGSATWADHGDHIHIATAAANIAAGAVAGAMARLDLPRFAGTNGVGGLVATGLNKVAAGAEKAIGDRLAQRGMVGETGALAGAYQGKLDRDFGRGSGTQISFDQAAFLAEKAGLPGVTYAQIAIGESNLTPGAVSSDGGYGLWQMTPRVQSAATVNAWENVGTYFNPWNNAQMAKILAGGGTGVSNYFGVGAVTDWNAHYTGKDFKAKGGVVLSGDSLGVGMKAVGFPGGWNLDVVGGRGSAAGAAKVPGLLDKYDPAALVFEHGSNDQGGSPMKAALSKIKGSLGDAGLALMNTTNNPAANRVIEGFGRMDELADWNAIASRYGNDLHPGPEGYRAMQKIVKAAANKAKKKGKDRKPGEEDEDGGRGAVGAGDGTQSYSPADIPKKILDMVKAHQDAIKDLDNQILLAEHFASYNSSEAGSSEGPEEIAKQLFLNTGLLQNLEGLAGWLKRGMRLKRTSKKGKGILQGWLDPLVGGTSELGVGRILEVKKRIDELKHPDLGTPEQTEAQQFLAEFYKSELLKANQRFALSQSQFRTLAATPYMGNFAQGGVALVGEKGPELAMLPSGTRVHSNAESQEMLSPTVNINVAPGMEWLKQFISVEVTNTTRKQARGRPLGGARGM